MSSSIFSRAGSLRCGSLPLVSGIFDYQSFLTSSLILSLFSIPSPCPRRGGGERSPLRDCIEDRFQYAVHVSEHFVVPESQNLVAAILDQLVRRSSFLIIRCSA